MIFYTLFLLYYASYVYNTQATQKEAGQAVAKVSGLAVAGNGRGEGGRCRQRVADRGRVWRQGVSGSDMGGGPVVARGWQAVSGGRQGVAGSGRRVARGQEGGRPWQYGGKGAVAVCSLTVAGVREAAAEGGSQWSWGKTSKKTFFVSM